MTTLGALLVGLVLLLLLLGVLLWLQRRARRGPEQPRTVADLVRMREAARTSTAVADDAPVAEAPAVADAATPEDVAAAPAAPEPVEAQRLIRDEPVADEQQADLSSPLSPADAAVDTP